MALRILVACICLAFAGNAPSLAQAAVKHEIDIPQQRLASALAELANQTKIQVIYATDLVEGRDSPPVNGTMTPEEALGKMLAKSGLGFAFVDAQTVTLSRLDGSAEPANKTSVQAPSRALRSQDEAGQKKEVQKGGENKSFWDRFRLAQLDQGGNSPVPAVGRATESQEASQKLELEEIVVTAQKREERLQNVPISISVLSGSDLNRSTVQGISEALNNVPGIATSESYLGGGTNIAIRGVASSFPFFAGSSAVAYYLDSVPFGLVKSAIGPDANAYDLERVEVLRGPQGTLYGASALNGVVRILTHDPDLSAFNLSARASGSGTEDGGGNYRGDLMVNVPLVEDKLAARVAIGYQNNSGWIDQPNKPDANETRIGTYRLKLAAQPTEQLSVGLSAWFSRSDSDAPDLGYTYNKTSSSLDQPTYTDYDAYGLKLGYQFPYFSVSSMTSYLKYANQGILGLDISGFGSVPGASFLSRVTSTVKSEELNINSLSEGPWRWSLGGMYRDATENRFQVFTVFAVPPIQYYDKSESYAAYGQVTRLLFRNQLELTAGLRYFNDRIPQHQQLAPGDPFVDALSTAAATTPRGTVTWHPTDQWTVYASYSQGFRSGFPQDAKVLIASPGFPAVRPDRLTNYEVGSKGSFFDGRLQFDASAYHIDWKDIQLQLNVQYQGVPHIAVVNGAAAKGNGIDLAVPMKLMKGLTLAPYISWNDMGLTSDVISSGLVLFSKGDRPSGSPQTTAGMAAEYSVAIANGYSANVSASVSRTSQIEYHSISSANTVLVQRSDAITISRLSVSVDTPSHCVITLFGDNLNNERGATARVFTDAIADWDARPRPRTVGLQFEYGFR